MNYKVIAIDADDTLWDCQSHFDRVEEKYCALLKDFAEAKTVSAELFKTETKNMPSLGFGSKAFTLSLIENAVKISSGKVKGNTIGSIMKLGNSLLSFPTTPLPEVEDTLKLLNKIKEKKYFQLVVFTKGELQDQENKLKRSGLRGYFDDVVIVSDKTEDEFMRMCHNYGIRPEELLMIGNSFKSDCAPALNIGATAIHIPFSIVWKMEKSEEWEHDNLIKIEHFKEVLQYV